jgi:hypothetical protein
VLVVGDSHVRAYGMNPFFSPVFLGSGKEINLLDWGKVDEVIMRITKVVEVFNSNSILLCLGEPDTRYALGCGWTPWNSRWPKDRDNFPLIDRCFVRYVTLVKELNESLGRAVFVQNIVLTQDPVQCNYIDYYNKNLSRALGHHFIEFNSHIRSDDGSINRNFSWDTVHANNRISRFVESYFDFDGTRDHIIENDVMKRHMKKYDFRNILKREEKRRSPIFKRLYGAIREFFKRDID